MAIRMQSFDSWNALRERQQSEELDQLLAGDFSCIAAYLQASMPNTPLEVRKVPFVRRYASELGGLYQRPVVRRFQAPGLPQEAWSKLGQVYADADIDGTLSTLEAGLWVQQTVAALVMPAGLGVSLMPLSPWQLDVTVANPLRPHDPASWSAVEILVPESVDAENGSVRYGTIRLTATEAWLQTGSRKVGLYSADGSHSFGAIPLAVAHAVKPVLGHVFAPVNEPVHNLQLALCQHESETELVVRHSAWPQKVLENAGIAQMTEEIQVGPDRVMALIRSGDPSAPGPTLRVVQGQLPVAELGAYIEGRIKLYCAMLGIDPSAFLRVNTAVTVSARMFAEATRAEMRGRMRPTLLRLERDIARLVGWVVSTTGAVQMPWRELSVDVRWQDWTPSPDPVADASAQRMRMQLGLSSPVDEVAMAGGLSRSAALRKVQDNLAEARGLGLIPGYQEPATAAADKAEDATEPADDNGADPADSTEEGDK